MKARACRNIGGGGGKSWLLRSLGGWQTNTAAGKSKLDSLRIKGVINSRGLANLGSWQI